MSAHGVHGPPSVLQRNATWRQRAHGEGVEVLSAEGPAVQWTASANARPGRRIFRVDAMGPVGGESRAMTTG
jgi:hypothetical protein